MLLIAYSHRLRTRRLFRGGLQLLGSTDLFSAWLERRQVLYVFQCRVLTGQFAAGSQNMKEPPQRHGTKFRYDSVTNSVNDPRIFVIFKDTQSYPEYLIAFKG